ncbi:hypothetical protein [Streptomyces monashensis]|uniref:Uncharacterized protein n=1 Tax=Streptomyces monashensis TaxID=1678012 RepID=A0A1S2QQC4_9ACTN|nr:hypothetical protein [Streptomyces monashensis]OIK07811.1 hypothetical protein BIV23_02240 [Streptomyces monashensis]
MSRSEIFAWHPRLLRIALDRFDGTGRHCRGFAATGIIEALVHTPRPQSGHKTPYPALTMSETVSGQ